MTTESERQEVAQRAEAEGFFHVWTLLGYVATNSSTAGGFSSGDARGSFGSTMALGCRTVLL